jgi:hypothetical protein
MRSFLIPAVVAFLVLAAGRPAFAAATPAATADDKGEKKGDGEKKRTKDGEDRREKLPKAVAAAVKTVFPGMTVVTAEKEDEDGDVVYEVTLRGKGGTLEVKLTPKGRVVEVELKGTGDKNQQKGEYDDKNDKKGEGKKGRKTGEDEKDEKKAGGGK